MSRLAMFALGASLTFGALAPGEAAAQLSGRERAEAARRGGVVVPQTDRRDTRTDTRRDGRYDERCYDDRYDDRRRQIDEQYRRDRQKLDARYREKLRKLEGRNDRRSRDEYSRLEREWRSERDRWDRETRNRDRDWDDDDDDDDDNRRRSGRRDDDCDNRNRSSKGPAFCRNGQGHPVHGMAWCRQKGWESGSLRNAGWSDILLRRPSSDVRANLGSSILAEILGRDGYRRIDSQRSRLGARGGLTGNWSETSNGSILDLYAGGLHIAQVHDRNRDGRADVVLLNYGR
jgi:hypothetical protein